MTREKPNCPQCNTNKYVRTMGGGTHSKYRYMCEGDDCNNLLWQQKPPHKIRTTENIFADLTISKKSSRRSSSYLCSVCKQPKKGHICKAYDDNVELSSNLVKNSFKPPAAALVQGNSPAMPFSDFIGLDSEQGKHTPSNPSSVDIFASMPYLQLPMPSNIS